jgi:hypothetical protein
LQNARFSGERFSKCSGFGLQAGDEAGWLTFLLEFFALAPEGGDIDAQDVGRFLQS